MKLALLIRSLEIGGAERQLVALARGLSERGHEVHIFTFYSDGALLLDLAASDVSVTNLDKRGRWDIVYFFMRLVKELYKKSPDVLYGFLPASNLVGLAAACCAGVPQIVWGVRASNMDLSQYDRLSRLETWLAGKLARYADKIICNSRAGANYHVRAGYPFGKVFVVENGIDADKFHFDAAMRDQVRREWSVAPSDFLIGISARLDPMKGHLTALQALSHLNVKVPAAKLACVGSGPLADQLQDMARHLQIEDRVIWAGERKDMPAVYSAFDVASSSSLGEGFSNTIAEAMSCERTCIVTDVGDSAVIVGNTGWIVPEKSPEALALAWQQAFNLTESERSKMGCAARQRIVEKFSVDNMVKRTLEILNR